MAPDSSASLSDLRCSVHGAEPGVATCAWCGRALCGACYRFDVGRSPACVLCAREVGTRRQRRLSLAVVIGLVGVATGAYVAVRARMEPLAITAGAVFGVLSVGLAVWIGRTGRVGDAALILHEREIDAEPTFAAAMGGGHPYRAAARRVVAAAAPKLSGGATASVVATALVLAGVAVPAALHLPRWIETEALLALVYVGLSGALSVLLYRGYRIEDDHRFFAPTPPWRQLGREAAPRPAAPRPSLAKGFSADGCGDVQLAGCEGCGEGCSGCGDVGEVVPMLAAGALVILAAIGAAIALVFFSWLVVEVALPLAFLAFYEMLLFSLRRVARDRHGCEGVPLRSLVYGMLWSAVAVAPVAGLTFLLHLLLGPHAG